MFTRRCVPGATGKRVVGILLIVAGGALMLSFIPIHFWVILLGVLCAAVGILLLKF